MDDTNVELRESSVILAEPAYFTAEACRAVIKVKLACESWYPRPPGEEVTEAPTQLGAPVLGGC
jgi:hypothetical protein